MINLRFFIFNRATEECQAFLSEESSKETSGDNGKVAFDPDYMMDETVINNKICNDVYKWAKEYTTQSCGTKQEFFTNLYKHDQYGLSLIHI